MAEGNAKTPLFRRGGTRKPYRIAQSDWWIELFADTDGAVPPGDVEIHSELNEVSQPGYRGSEDHADRPRAVRHRGAGGRDRENTRRAAAIMFAEIRYQDDSGPQTFFVTQNEISIGRGGEDLWVDLALYTKDEVSREHLRLRRDPASGAFTIIDHEPQWHMAQRPAFGARGRRKRCRSGPRSAWRKCSSCRSKSVDEVPCANSTTSYPVCGSFSDLRLNFRVNVPSIGAAPVTPCASPWKSGAATDTGLLRQCNEDRYWVDDELGVFLVVDGVGGHAAGELAARPRWT